MLRGVLRLLKAVDDVEAITGVRKLIQTRNLHRTRRHHVLHPLAAIVGDVADASERTPRNDELANGKLPVLHEQIGDGATSRLDARLDDRAASRATEIGLEFQQFCLVFERLKQLIDTDARRRARADDFGGAAPLDGIQLVLSKLAENRLNLRVGGFGLVDLVERNDDRDASGLGVVDRLDGLRHDAVISRDNQHDDVGDGRTAGTHRCKRFVARRIDKNDLALLVAHFHGHAERTRRLRDAACFAACDVRVADAVEQRGLAVVDVAQNRDDRTARTKIFRLTFLELLSNCLLGRLGFQDLKFNVVLEQDFLGLLGLDTGVDGRGDAFHEEAFDDLGGLHAGGGRKILDRERCLNRDPAAGLGEILLSRASILLLAKLLATLLQIATRACETSLTLGKVLLGPSRTARHFLCASTPATPSGNARAAGTTVLTTGATPTILLARRRSHSSAESATHGRCARLGSTATRRLDRFGCLHADDLRTGQFDRCLILEHRPGRSDHFRTRRHVHHHLVSFRRWRIGLLLGRCVTSV